FLFISLDVLAVEENIPKATAVIFYSGLVVSILGILQFIFHFGLLDLWIKENLNLFRINSTMDDPNSLGIYLAVVFCAGAFSLSSKSTARLMLKLSFLVIVFVALFLTASRSAIGSLLLVVFLLPLILNKAGLSVEPESQIRKVWFERFSIGIVLLLCLL